MLNSGAVPAPAQPESAERVEWTDTRNLPMSRGDRPAAESLKALGLEKHQALIVGSSPELCVKVRGSSSMLLLGCLGDLLRFEKREIQVATFAPDRSSP